MKLRFVLGCAGSGKTHLCLDEITADLAGDAPGGRDGGPCIRRDYPLFFLVPEQATFQMERALLSHRPDIRTSSRARVTSFKRLGRLALEWNGPALRRPIGELGKILALGVVAERLKGTLGIFAPVAQTEGFLEALSAALSELRVYRHTAGAIAGAAAHLPEGDPLRRKLLDVARLEEAYSEFIAGRFQDPDELLDAASVSLAEAPLVQGARVWIDGFAGFTPQEFHMLSQIMRQCDEMTVALCLDRSEVEGIPADQWEEGPPDGLFNPTRRTLVRLRDLARALGVQLLPPVLLPRHAPAPRFVGSPFLACLERELVQSGTAGAGRAVPEEAQPGDAAAACRIVEAPDRFAEVEAAAEEIVRLVRDEGYRYRDIAVVTRDLEVYRDAVEATFTEWEIPFFLDYKPSAYHHPLVTLVQAAVEMAAEGVSHERLFRYLKTDLVPLSRDDVDRLENEMWTRGIPARAAFGEALWNELFAAEGTLRRASGVGALERFLRRTGALFSGEEGDDAGHESRSKAGVDALVECVDELLESLDAQGTLSRWSEEAAASGDRLAAQEHAQVWNGVCDVLDQAVAVMGSSPVTRSEFAALIGAGLKRLRLGRVPPRIDQVLVGSIERSRQPDLACVVVLGLNDGVFPAVPGEDAVFSDDDRARLVELGVELAAGSRQRLFHEKYLLYVALTRASRRLTLTYSRTDESGRALRPSQVIPWLRRRFPSVTYEQVPSSPRYDRLPERRGALEGWLARLGRRALDGHAFSEGAADVVLSAYEWHVARPGREGAGPGAEGREARLCALSSLGYVNRSEPLTRELVAALYGERPSASPSRLEETAACRFRHFARYGLRLEERRRPQVDAAITGSLAHAALSAFVRRLIESRRDWATLARGESDALVREILAELSQADEYAALRSSAGGRYALARLRAALETVVWALGEHARRGDFRPVAVERSFGEGAALPPVVVETPLGVPLRLYGRIDRIDEAQKEGRRYLRVIDYKSSARKFRLTRLYYGLDLQLMIYLLAAVARPASERNDRGKYGEAVEKGPVEAAGCLYIPVFDPLVRVDAPPSGEAEWLKELKADGLIVDDGEVPRMMDREAEGASELVPLAFNKDGRLGANSSVAAPEQMETLFTYTRRVAGELAGKWLAGGTEIDPYELSKETPCGTCAFKPVCQFDPATVPGGYRRLRPLRDSEVWSLIGEALAEAGDERAG